jgi:hypothetical protein
MKKTCIIGYHSPDIDLETFTPDICDNFGFLLEVFVGFEGENGEECFDMFICTPKWIEQHYSKQTVLVGLHTIMVQEYNFERIKSAIEEMFHTSGATWKNAIKDLRYYGLSEHDFKHWTSYNNFVKCGVPERGKT